MREILATAVLAVACSKGAAPAPRAEAGVPHAVTVPADAPALDAAPRRAAAPPDAGTVPFGGDPGAEARALGIAVAALDVHATEEWTDRAAHNSQDGVLPGEISLPSLPKELDVALRALSAWDLSKAPLHVDCASSEEAVLLALVALASAALATAAQPDWPPVHAAARLGQALRSADNSAFAIGSGIEVARRVAEWSRKRGPTAGPRGLAPEPDLVLRVARADVRCQLAALPALRAQLARDPAAAKGLADVRRDMGLVVSDHVVDDELVALEAFVRETQAIIDRARSPGELSRSLQARLDLVGSRPPSVLIRTYGAPYGYRMVAHALEEYRAAAGR